MKSSTLFYTIFLFAILAFTSTASIIVPTPAAALQKRQSINATAIGSFSISGIDSSLSALLSSKSSALSSYAAGHSTTPFTSFASQSSSACPASGLLPNGECCASGMVIAGKCYEGTASTSSTSSSSCAASTGHNVAGSSLRLSFASTALFISTFSAFLLGCIILLA